MINLYVPVSREEAVASSRDIILFSLLLAAKGIKGAVSDSPHVLITGQTGKGKSFLAKLLWISHSLKVKCCTGIQNLSLQNGLIE